MSLYNKGATKGFYYHKVIQPTAPLIGWKGGSTRTPRYFDGQRKEGDEMDGRRRAGRRREGRRALNDLGFGRIQQFNVGDALNEDVDSGFAAGYL